MLRAVILPLVAAIVFVTCGDGDAPRVDITPESATTPTLEVAESPVPGADGDRANASSSPTATAVPAPLEVTGFGPTVHWRDIDGEAYYVVEGEAVWVPGCEDAQTGTARIQFRESLPSDTSEYSFPGSASQEISLLKEFTIDVTAWNASGAKIGSGGKGFVADPRCP